MLQLNYHDHHIWYMLHTCARRFTADCRLLTDLRFDSRDGYCNCAQQYACVIAVLWCNYNLRAATNFQRRLDVLGGGPTEMQSHAHAACEYVPRAPRDGTQRQFLRALHALAARLFAQIVGGCWTCGLWKTRKCSMFMLGKASAVGALQTLAGANFVNFLFKCFIDGKRRKWSKK